jgi:LPPG:FO 2-phospho-L-lactate transferase
MTRIAVLAGGVGGARFLEGLVAVTDPGAVSAVVNTGDDLTLWGLRICPDLDTVTYTLAGRVNRAQGWGVADERFIVHETLKALGQDPWFLLGDRDLAIHLTRTQLLGEGRRLTEVTVLLATALGVSTEILPMTDDPVATTLIAEVVTDEGAQIRELAFQEYFVRLRQRPRVQRVRYDGAAEAHLTEEVRAALARAEAIIIAPSNPILSIWPILAVPGLRPLLEARRDQVVVVSPLAGGRAFKGPLVALLDSLVHQHDVRVIAQLYQGLASAIVIDEVDSPYAREIESLGLEAIVTDIAMPTPRQAAKLAEVTLGVRT